MDHVDRISDRTMYHKNECRTKTEAAKAREQHSGSRHSQKPPVPDPEVNNKAERYMDLSVRVKSTNNWLADTRIPP
jgi:hypothetical protein